MSKQLDNLLKKRSSIHRNLSRFQNFLETSNLEEQINVCQLKERLANIKNCLSEFNNVQEQIESHDASASTESHDSERNLFENFYYSLVTRAQIIIDEVTDTSISSNGNASNSSNTDNLSQIKLPTLSLPTFSGEYDQWLGFYDTFKSLIHDNKSLSKVQKFHYLRCSLKAEAYLVIESIEVSSDNYDIAWELLKHRFENKPFIIYSHVKALHDLEVVSRESYVALNALLNNFQKTFARIKNA